MRHHASVTSMSWIPSEAITGMMRMPFESGIAHYDAPPPDRLDDGRASLEALRDADRFRFANHLSAWIDVDGAGRVTDAGYDGGGLIGSTTLRMGRAITVAAVALPDKQAEPEIGATSVRFLQTAGGRTGVPAPRVVRRPPFVQYHAPIAWSTLSLTIHADGRSEGRLVGASPFPRHWVYDHAGALVAKSGLVDWDAWAKEAFGSHTPWGDLDSPALVTEVESALERVLSAQIMRRDAAPRIVRVPEGRALVHQGDEGDELYLLLDGVLAIDVDGAELAQLGPGVVLGEHAVLGDGTRTATLRAVTPCKVAAVAASAVERGALADLARGHRREHEGR